MKKTILTIGLLLFIAGISPVMAQDNKPQKKEQLKKMTPAQIAVKKTDRMKKELNLTDTQYKEMYEVNLRHAREREALRIEKHKLKQRAEIENKKHKEGVSKILTAAQKEKQKELIEKRKANKENKRGTAPRPPKPPRP